MPRRFLTTIAGVLALLWLLPMAEPQAAEPLEPPLGDGPLRGFTKILKVGPSRALKQPSDAARVAPNRALVLIDPGLYTNDVAVWRQNDLTLKGNGGRVRLVAGGRDAEGKAIWVIRGNRVWVEGIEFAGARVESLNGAGIRFEGTDLTLSDCRFDNNEMGILTAHNPASTIVIQGCEFFRNTVDYRRHHHLGHNIYVGRVRRLVLRNSYSHGAQTGHQVKSRAAENFILYNRIADESGHASYLVDLPEGGEALVMGNLLQKSADAENQSAIAFAAEANREAPGQRLYVVHNTLVTDYPGTLLVNNHSTAEALVANNLVQGEARVLLGPGRSLSNLILPQAGLRDAQRVDYRLLPKSPAIDAGAPDLTTSDGKSLLPRRQYLAPLGSESRPVVRAPDVGAYEFPR